MNRRLICTILATLMAWQSIAIASAATAADIATEGVFAADHCGGQQAGNRVTPGSELPSCCRDEGMTIAACLSACFGPAMAMASLSPAAASAVTSTPGFAELLIVSATYLPLIPPPIA